MKVHQILGSLLLATMVAGCGAEASVADTGAAAPLSSADEDAIRQSAADFVTAALANDANALANLYAEDAVLMFPNEPAVVGRDAIRTRLAADTYQAFTLQVSSVEGRGDLAYSRGTYTIRFQPGSEGDFIDDTGKWLVVQRKQDGSWLNIADIYNSDEPPK